MCQLSTRDNNRISSKQSKNKSIRVSIHVYTDQQKERMYKQVYVRTHA